MDYIFVDGSYPGVPNLELIEVEDEFEVGSRYGSAQRVNITCLEVFHGSLPVTGFRIGRFGYVTDASQIPESTFDRLAGVDILVMSALRFETHPTHQTIGQAIEAAQRIGARKTYFIHMTHSILHARDSARLPVGIEFGYDGLVVETER